MAKHEIALIGAGRIGEVHAGNIAAHDRLTLSCVSDVSPDRAATLAAQYGATAVTADDIFSNPAIAGVLIASSTDSHADFIERAAHSGKAIFCEKPVDLSLERINACLDVVKSVRQNCWLGIIVAMTRIFSL